LSRAERVALIPVQTGRGSRERFAYVRIQPGVYHGPNRTRLAVGTSADFLTTDVCRIFGLGSRQDSSAPCGGARVQPAIIPAASSSIFAASSRSSSLNPPAVQLEDGRVRIAAGLRNDLEVMHGAVDSKISSVALR